LLCLSRIHVVISCRRLGFDIQHYWRMRFCSSACLTDYQLRLAEKTKEKISRLDVDGQSELRKSVRASSKMSSKVCGNLRPKPLATLKSLAAKRA
jgi:hypothetical protein